MARKDTRRKSKSDYTLLQRKHKLTNNGAIFEKDLMTISKMDELFSDQIPIYSDSNFKFSIRTGNNSQRKHSRGNWDCPDSGMVEDACSWTRESMEGLSNEETTENKVVLNPDYTSILDFAYYGSAVDLFQASVNDIIMNFPGELYFARSGKNFENDEIFYDISNQYNIDVDTLSLGLDETYNPLRYFCYGLREFVIINKDGSVIDLNDLDDLTWTVTQLNPSCQEMESEDGAWLSKVNINSKNGGIDITIYVRYVKGEKKLYYIDKNFCGLRIRPNDDNITNYFNNLSPFEKVLLTRDSSPIYTSTFTTYRETDTATYFENKNYTWPSKYGYNPDTDGGGYSSYIQDMIKLCQYHDEHNTDNIWRKLTHESIKNLDWTFTRQNGDNIDVIDEIDSTKIKAALRLYGRVYDDIKLYMESIKNSNKVTYNGKGNTPDYMLSDILENKGFDARSLNITSDNSIETEQLYSGAINGYTASDANIAFDKRLILNSRYILSRKGTRDGIETMLAILGFDKDEYEINEYVVVASGGTYENFGDVEAKIDVNYPLLDNIDYINAYRDSINYYLENDYDSNEDIDRSLYKLPMKAVYLENDEGEEQAYVVPWYDNNKLYDNRFIFQSEGGWAKRVTKTINLAIAPEITEIKSSNLFSIYGETLPPLKFARDFEELTSFGSSNVSEGDICYVTDISKILDVYNFLDEEEREKFINGEHSHYFVLCDSNIATWVGYYSSTTVEDVYVYGWKNIYESEFNTTNDKLTENGKRVIYYESIKEDTIGNNPHFGNGKYDNGDSYIEAMTKPFKYAAETEDFSWFDDEDVEKFKDYGFTPVWYKDNKKCWYFTNEDNINDQLKVKDGSEYKDNGILVVGEDEDLIPFNPQGGDGNDEAAADSVINVKNMEIIFKPKKFVEETRKYLEEHALAYIEEMIPSTTVFRYKISGDTEDIILKKPYIGSDYDENNNNSGGNSGSQTSDINTDTGGGSTGTKTDSGTEDDDENENTNTGGNSGISEKEPETKTTDDIVVSIYLSNEVDENNELITDFEGLEPLASYTNPSTNISYIINGTDLLHSYIIKRVNGDIDLSQDEVYEKYGITVSQDSDTLLWTVSAEAAKMNSSINILITEDSDIIESDGNHYNIIVAYSEDDQLYNVDNKSIEPEDTSFGIELSITGQTPEGINSIKIYAIREELDFDSLNYVGLTNCDCVLLADTSTNYSTDKTFIINHFTDTFDISGTMPNYTILIYFYNNESE